MRFYERLCPHFEAQRHPYLESFFSYDRDGIVEQSESDRHDGKEDAVQGKERGQSRQLLGEHLP